MKRSVFADAEHRTAPTTIDTFWTQRVALSFAIGQITDWDPAALGVAGFLFVQETGEVQFGPAPLGVVWAGESRDKRTGSTWRLKRSERCRRKTTGQLRESTWPSFPF